MKRLIAVLLFPMVASAEPGPVTHYLMNERANLLDIGMMRLETLTTEFERRVGLHWTVNGNARFFRAEINSRYEADDDKIYVSFLIMDSEPTDAQMAEGCDNAMGQLHIWLRKSLPGLFLHVGYDDPSKPPDLFNAFQDMIVMHCYFSSGRDSSEGRFWAYRRLGDREMTGGRWETSN